MCRQHGKAIEALLRSANDVSESVIPLWLQDFFPCWLTNAALIKMDVAPKRPIFMIIRELNAEACKASVCGGM